MADARKPGRKKSNRTSSAGAKKGTAPAGSSTSARAAGKKKTGKIKTVPRVVPTGSYRVGGPRTSMSSATRSSGGALDQLDEDLQPDMSGASPKADFAHEQEGGESQNPQADQVPVRKIPSSSSVSRKLSQDDRSDPTEVASEADEEDAEYDDSYMSIGDHLEELRLRLFWMIGIVVGFSGIAGFFSTELHKFLVSPYNDLTNERLILQNVYGGMEIYIKVSVLAGVIVAFPALVFILWGFITPAVSRRIALFGHLAVAWSAILFWSGIAVCWFYVFPISLNFLFIGMQLESVAPVMAVERYYSFLFAMHLASGLSFQLPIILVALGAFGILTVDWHKRTWKYAMVGIYFFSAVITPPDPWSMLAVGSMLMILYGISIGIVWIIERGRRKAPTK